MAGLVKQNKSTDVRQSLLHEISELVLIRGIILDGPGKGLCDFNGYARALLRRQKNGIAEAYGLFLAQGPVGFHELDGSLRDGLKTDPLNMRTINTKSPVPARPAMRSKFFLGTVLSMRHSRIWSREFSLDFLPSRPAWTSSVALPGPADNKEKPVT